MATTNNILIRSINPELQTKIQELSTYYSQKTASKTIIRLIENHLQLIQENENLKNKITSIDKEKKLLEGFAENIRYELSYLPLKE